MNCSECWVCKQLSISKNNGTQARQSSQSPCTWSCSTASGLAQAFPKVQMRHLIPTEVGDLPKVTQSRGDQRQELWSLSGTFYPPETQWSRDWVLALRSPRHLRCPGPCPSLGGTKRSLAGRWRPQTPQASACLQPGSRGFIRCALGHTPPGHMHNRIFKKCFESLIYLFVIVFHNSFHSKARTCF